MHSSAEFPPREAGFSPEPAGRTGTLFHASETASTPSGDDFLAGHGIPGMVSVIIPSYNRADIVGETINSVLTQSYGNLETIVVDDGSTDSTREVISRYADSRVQYFHKENGGLSSARNFGLTRARGEFIAFLDSDDVWEDWKLAAQVEILRLHPDVGLVWSDMSTFETAGRVLAARHLRTYYSAYREVSFEDTHEPMGVLSGLVREAPREWANCPYFVADIYSHMFSGNLVHPPTAIVRRERLRKSGPFQPAVTGEGAEDYHFYFRIAALGAVAFLDAPTTLYRVHSAQMSTVYSLKEARGNLNVVTYWSKQLPPTFGPSKLRRRLASCHAWLGAEELRAGNLSDATRHLWRSLRLDARQPSTAGRLVLSILPERAANVLRSFKRTFASLIAKQIITLIILLSNDQEILFRFIGLLQPELADI